MILNFIVMLILSAIALAQNAEVITSCTVPHTAALTFDDGPWSYIHDISNALTAANGTGTFFFNGNNWGCIYDTEARDRIKYVYDRGHQVASHTWGHQDLTTLSWNQIHDEMWRVEQALQRITGAYPAFMRPPFGNYNDLVLRASYIRGQKVVLWDFDSGDSIGASPARSIADYDALINRRPSTINALNHETIQTTAYQVIPYVIRRLKSAGYRLVTLAECVDQQPYRSVGPPGVPDDSWDC